MTKSITYISTAVPRDTLVELLGVQKYKFTWDCVNAKTIVQPMYGYYSERVQRDMANDARYMLRHTSGGDIITMVLEPFKAYGVDTDYNLWLRNRKGHDQWHYKADRNITVNFTNAYGSGYQESSLRITDIWLVGEGNALRKVRRYIQQRLTNNNRNWKESDVEEIYNRAGASCTVLIRFKSGLVLNLNTGVMLDNTDLRAQPSHLDNIFTGCQVNEYNPVITLSEPTVNVVRALQLVNARG